MSIYDRKRLTHSRKVITTSSYQSSIKETRRKLSETIFSDQASSLLVIRERLSSQGAFTGINNNRRLGKSEDVWGVKKIPTIFVSISKPSTAIDRLLEKRKTGHQDAVNNMRDELAGSYTACEQEFKDRSVSVKIQINCIRRGIEEVRDKLRKINPLDLNSEDYEAAWRKVSDLIKEEKQIVDHFYERLLIIEKKRLERAKSILKKYYKIFHNISFFLPYEIQVYLENEILNYNEAVLGNHRIYADLHLQMRLFADAAKMSFIHFMEKLKIDIGINGI